MEPIAKQINSLEDNVIEPGNYEGLYHDILGKDGRIRFTFEGNEANIKGICKIIIFSDEEPVIYETIDDKQLNLSPPRVGKEFMMNIVFKLSDLEGDTLEEEQKEVILITAEFNFNVQDAIPFANKSIFGHVYLKGDPGLKGGTWIAWKNENSQGGYNADI